MTSRSVTSRASEKSKDAQDDAIELDTSAAAATTTPASSSTPLDDAIGADDRFWWTIGGLSGGLAVAFGAFGAHGLKARVTDTYYLDIWQTASQYHLAHALAILAAPVVVASMRRHRARTGLGVWTSLRANLLGSTIKPAAGSSTHQRVRPYRNWSARCFLFGTVFFSGSLYALTLTENKKWGAVTPIGGVGFILGW
jgi:uncharacterized membrane protein YgdD (TMEM256/DUF423 family)